ncbi:hypothetical protein GA0070618_3276 [Micromonospora echinospora]|uniref:Uncharacterized protein n=1 Tax=Micromonospora echinospora TaxID=1877 RepID=A0A1C4XR32_MICEC|nr:hypothetical protein [Micromonospora echinospora]SCF10970.1 hypothetical protein GA0070618_3276 [Micromonospora echinospora]
MRVFPRRVRRRRAWLRPLIAAAVAAVVALAPSPAVATDPVDYQAAKFHDGVFAAYMRAHNGGVAGLKNLVLTAELLDWRTANRGASRDDVVRHLVATRQAVDAAGVSDTTARTTYATTIKVIDALSGVPGVSIGAPMVKALLDATIGGTVTASAEVEDAVTSAYQHYRWMDALYGVQERAWGQLTRAAAQDADLAAAWDGTIGAQVNVRATATTEQLLADPVLASFINTEAILEHLGNEQAYLAALRTQLTTALDKVSGQNAEIIERLAAADLKYPVGPGPKPTPQDYTNALAEAASRQVAIDAAGSAVSILATLAGFADEKAGKEVLALGKAAVGIATAINQYLPTVAGLGLSEALGSLSTIVLTGNVLGAVMTLAPLFFGSGPSEHELVMQEIGKLREQVAALRTEMHDRFDRVEAMLTAIYDDVMSIMLKMSTDLDGIIRDIDAVKRQIGGLESRVDQLSLSMQEALKKSALSDTEYVINTYVGYRARNGRTLGVAQYDEAEGRLFTTATSTSTGAPFVLTPTEWAQPGTDPARVLDEKGPYGAVDYLSHLARTWDPTFPATNRVPHAGVWTMSARAYNALALENPALAGDMTSENSFAVRLRRSGQSILDAGSRFSQPGPDGHRNALFTGLVDGYRSAVNAQSAELRRLRDSVTGGGYNPWYGPDQAPPVRLTNTRSYWSAVPNAQGKDEKSYNADGKMNGCGQDGLPRVQIPANVQLADLPNALQLLTYGTKEQFQPHFRICYDAVFVNFRTTTGPRLETTTADLQLTVRQQMSLNQGDFWMDVRSHRNTHSAGIICSWSTRENPPTGYCHDETYVMRYEDGGHRTAFESGAGSADNPERLTIARTKADRMLWGKQKQYHQVVNDAFADPTSQLRAKNKKITEMVRLLQAYTRLGFPVALENDGSLSGHLFGDTPLPSDYRHPAAPVGRELPQTNISRAYVVAEANYAPCTQSAAGDPCPDGMTEIDPRAGQTPIYSPACSGADSPGSPNEYLGNCIHAVAIERADALGALYETHSQRLAANVYTERLPEVASVIDQIRVTGAAVTAS